MSFVYNSYQYFTPNGVDMQTNFYSKRCVHTVALRGVIQAMRFIVIAIGFKPIVIKRKHALTLSN